MKNSIRVKITKLILFLAVGLLNIPVEVNAQSIPTNEKQSTLKLTTGNKDIDKHPVRKITDKKHKASKIEPVIKRTGTSSVKASATK